MDGTPLKQNTIRPAKAYTVRHIKLDIRPSSVSFYQPFSTSILLQSGDYTPSGFISNCKGMRGSSPANDSLTTIPRLQPFHSCLIFRRRGRMPSELPTWQHCFMCRKPGTDVRRNPQRHNLQDPGAGLSRFKNRYVTLLSSTLRCARLATPALVVALGDQLVYTCSTLALVMHARPSP